ncbi:hypothetical protein LshimejAT787_1302900 [Lyophyllum shimeji]|uniref:Uncharacterized protein n=1 Tax=Lyophyllum shimeji TaxID=47721 RepID=A0A9P3UQ09_LYOSH|nr:hypothetical protein LshimejAT787_1302900 [Lyophyllum shimeji]
MLKRSRHSDSIGSRGSPRILDEDTRQISKKLKLHEEVPVLSLDQAYDLRTPHPTLLSEAQIFRLESSRGRSLPKDHEFSPVPPAPARAFSDTTSRPQKDRNETSQPLHRTSSRNLKENIVPLPSRSSSKSGTRPSRISSGRGTATSFARSARSQSKGTSKDMPLASPFTSQPGSPDLPTARLPTQRAPGTTKSKRTLSDTHFNPNLPSHRILSQPQAQSTTNSPVRQPDQDDSFKARRPSAPSATTQRPDFASWFIEPLTKTNLEDNRFLTPSIFDLSGTSSRGPSIDFNRPPSQLSYISTYDEAIFADALGISTPFMAKPQRSGSATFPDSPNSSDEEEVHRTLGNRVLRPSIMRNPLHLTLGSDMLGSWMSDSLISPPTLSEKGAYTRHSLHKDVDMQSSDHLVVADDDSLGLGSGLKISRSSGSKAFGEEEVPATLQELFDCLDSSLGAAQSRPPISRTRSLDVEIERSQEDHPLRSPAQISPSQLRHSSTNTAQTKRGGRDRRGTIRASDFAVLQGTTTSVFGGGGPRRTRSGTIVQGPSHPRRERSGTILARPPVSLTPSTVPVRPSDDGDVDMLDIREEAGHKEVGDVPMSTDESDDELLLKEAWSEEAWVVASPQSPQLPRRSARKVKGICDWRKRRRLGKGLGSWGMAEHDEDDGTDDPLLLK